MRKEIQDHWTKNNITTQRILILGKWLFIFIYVNGRALFVCFGTFIWTLW